MPLSNQQYDLLLHEYEVRQNRSRREQLRRKDEIYLKIPEYEEIEKSISSIAVSQARKLISGDENALAELHSQLSELKDRKKKLLEAAGYPSDYLEPIYECPLCKDTGYIESKKCKCLTQKITALLYEQSSIEDFLKQENFSVLSYDYYQGEDLERFRIAVSACKSFVQDFSKTYRNILFTGDIGAGKSFLSNCIAHELIESGYQVLYFSSNNLFATLAENTLGKSHETLYNKNQDIYNCDLLLIDDLGTEYTNAFGISQLFACLSERHLRNKATIISTNLPLMELRNRYSERIFSRISSNFEIFKITGPDIRVHKKAMTNRK